MEFEFVLCVSSFKQTLLGPCEMVRASFPFWSLKQSVSTCLNCFCPRGLKLKKNVIIICGCYAWHVVTWQGGHVGGQYNKQCFEEFTWKRLLVPRGDIKQFCSWSPTWPLWRHVQISNASHLNMSNAIFLIFFQWPKLNNSQHCVSNNVGIRCVRLHVAKSLTTFKAKKKTGHFLSVENTKPIHLKIGPLPS